MTQRLDRIEPRRAARRAGKYPKTTPTRAEKPKAIRTIVGSTRNGTFNRLVVNQARPPLSPQQTCIAVNGRSIGTGFTHEHEMDKLVLLMILGMGSI